KELAGGNVDVAGAGLVAEFRAAEDPVPLRLHFQHSLGVDRQTSPEQVGKDAKDQFRTGLADAGDFLLRCDIQQLGYAHLPQLNGGHFTDRVAEGVSKAGHEVSWSGMGVSAGRCHRIAPFEIDPGRSCRLPEGNPSGSADYPGEGVNAFEIVITSEARIRLRK